MIDLPTPQAATRLAALLQSPESKTLDFKRLGGGKVAKMLETVCAFANTEGGWLVIGVADPKDAPAGNPAQQRLWGVQENPEAFDELQRKCRTHFNPPVGTLTVYRLPCTLRDGSAGHVALLRVGKSEHVHSVVDGGTWARGDASNRQLGAGEITDLSYRRGERSAESEPVAVPLALLDTPAWRSFVGHRGLRAGSMAEQLQRIGLAEVVTGPAGNELTPRRAAVLLFAEEPGSLLAAFGSRADIRLMVYAGNEVGSGATPNLRKPPKTIRGPLIEQIDTADIVIRLFDDRITVESPGAFPGTITAGNIQHARSKARNPLVAQNLREVPLPPNIDDGEGVRMMFGEMAAAHLYPPQYRQTLDTAVEGVAVTLLNEDRPPAWVEVSDWIDRNGPIANAELCRIAAVDTLRASKMLRGWVDRGLLEPLAGRSRSQAAYRKPALADEQASLLGDAGDEPAPPDAISVD